MELPTLHNLQLEIKNLTGVNFKADVEVVGAGLVLTLYPDHDSVVTAVRTDAGDILRLAGGLDRLVRKD